uniref:Uncharacterized protein n=1 Tax=Aegilops tauschii subsp. strangulata TaxID=200361 RepID=A0A453HJV5_AEGTS
GHWQGVSRVGVWRRVEGMRGADGLGRMSAALVTSAARPAASRVSVIPNSGTKPQRRTRWESSNRTKISTLVCSEEPGVQEPRGTYTFGLSFHR